MTGSIKSALTGWAFRGRIILSRSGTLGTSNLSALDKLTRSARGSVELVYASSETIWYSTPEQTGIRQLMIIALLRPSLEHEGEPFLIERADIQDTNDMLLR